MPQKNFPRDSVIAYIPLSVTADLGVAMRRVRAKRINQIKEICPSLFQNANVDANKSTTAEGGYESNSQQSDVDDSDNEGSQDRSGGAGGGGEAGNDNKHNKKDMPNTGVRRAQYGSIVEYLEAKYARGVMIDDLDERIRERKKQKKKLKDTEGGGGGEEAAAVGDDMSVLSDSDVGSCYSMESGNFIDDSALNRGVAHQILSSSAYGKTKIEARGANNGDDNNSVGGNDDHGFFVNIGDLEMEDGWTEHDLDDDEDWNKMMAKAKGKKRKRSTKENVVKDSDKTKKKVKKQQNNEEKNKKKTSNSEPKKNKPIIEKKEKVVNKAKPQVKEKPTKPQEKPVKAASSTNTKNTDDDNKNISKPSPVKESKEVGENKAKIDTSRKECTNLKRRITRLYKKCVEEIKNLKAGHLPRKSKKKEKSKVSIIVPGGKKCGDKISFSNPHDPTQKLQVLVPENLEAGEVFKVSVPLPRTKHSANAENKFTKECINALDEYSQVYDEWCQSEAKYREMLPTKRKGPEFKVGTERLKKYDQMLEEFPKNLEIPIDAPFLRKVVRRKRQNENKRLKLMEEAGKKPEPIKIKKEKKRKEPEVMVSLNLPSKGVKFPEMEFNVGDFGKSKQDT